MLRFNSWNLLFCNRKEIISIKDCFNLGLFVYGVYETTNMAIFKKWRWSTYNGYYMGRCLFL